MRTQPLLSFKLLLMTVCLLLPLAVQAQSNGATGVPARVRFTGALTNGAGAPRAGTVGILFAIYSEQTGGAPLWQETQNVQLDAQGRYAALLGSGRDLPKDIFVSNDARWLGVQVLADAEPEQGRVLLVSVPYALKAQDAETLGGRPASDYVLSAAVGGLSTNTKTKYSGGQAAAPTSEGTVITSTSVTTNAIPKFSATDTLADSMMLELYNQAATDAFGFALPNEDVLRLGDGSGLKKRLQVAGRVVAEGFDMNTSAANSLHIVNTNANGIGLQANADGAGFATAIFGSARSFNGAGATFFSFPPIGGGSPAPSDYSVAMYTANYNAQGVGVQAQSPYDGAGGAADPVLTGPIGLYAAAAHSTGIAAVLDQRAAGGGKLLSGRANGTEVITMTSAGNITATGSVTAASFSGSGAGLTGIPGGNLASDPAACASNRFVTDIAADGTLTCTQPSSSNLSDVASLATKVYADAGDTALAAPQYVTLAANATLANERVLTAGKGIAITDGGAGNPVIIENKVDFAQVTVQSGDTLSSIGASGAVFATTYTIPANTITAGSVIEVWAAGAQITDPSGMSFGYGVDLNSTSVTSLPLAGIFQNADTTGTWTLEVRIICISVSGSTATLEARGTNLNTSSAANWAVRNFTGSGITVDPTVAQVLSIRELVNTNGSDTSTMRQLIVKILK